MTTVAPSPSIAPGQASKPAAKSATKPNNLTGVTDVQVKPKRKVTYVFKFSADPKLKLPYAWAVNGVAGDAFKSRPGRINGSGAKIELSVQAGDTVTLFLNSDAHPGYRKQPVYAVTPNAQDIVVTITEKLGKHNDTDIPVLKAKPKASANPSATGKSPAKPEADQYTASLTGDIWMKVSHKYSEAEVAALLPTDASPEVVAGVKRIYAGLSARSLTITVPAKGKEPKREVQAEFADADNPIDNITSFDLLKDGLPRVHPAAFAAMFTAALESNISTVKVSSNWRPLVGSIVHRAGLGLDMTAIDTVGLNRSELLSAQANKNEGDGVTADEHRLYKEYRKADDAKMAADTALEDAGKARTAAEAALGKARAALAAAKTPDAKAAAQKKVAARTEAMKLADEASDKAAMSAIEAIEQRAKAKVAWETEKSANEPDKVNTYRTRLMQCRCVTQVFDPWYLDSDTQDKAAPQHNAMKSGNERLHRHHLHITVAEPKIL